MSTRRLLAIATVPQKIKRIFQRTSAPSSKEEHMWRERVARMILDGIGHSNLAMKPKQHNEAVRYARRWFRQIYADHPDDSQVDNAEATFDSGGIGDFYLIRDCVLAVEPFMFEEPDDDKPSRRGS